MQNAFSSQGVLRAVAESDGGGSVVRAPSRRAGPRFQHELSVSHPVRGWERRRSRRLGTNRLDIVYVYG